MADDQEDTSLRGYYKKLKKKLDKADEADASEYMGSGYADEAAKAIKRKRKQDEKALEEIR
jgi:hypothetical protein